MSKSQARRRNRGIYVACTEEERDAIMGKAADAGLSAGGFLRACALGRVTSGTKRRPPIDREVLEKAIAELRRVGNNINQIARAANMNEPTEAARLTEALDDYTLTLQQLRKAREL